MKVITIWLYAAYDKKGIKNEIVHVIQLKVTNMGMYYNNNVIGIWRFYYKFYRNFLLKTSIFFRVGLNLSENKKKIFL